MGRYFVRFKQETEREMVTSSLMLMAGDYAEPYSARKDEDLLIADLGPEELEAAQNAGAEIYEDVRFHPVASNPVLPDDLSEEWEYWRASTFAGEIVATQSDVMRHVKAHDAWELTTGEGVTIAIVDTGVSGAHAEFPQGKRSPHSMSYSFADAWQDPKGHGSMCACAATATTTDGGRYNGVAPGASLLSARTTLFSTDIYKLYDSLIDLHVEGRLDGPLVISNSYGLYVCDPPKTLPEDHPYLGIVREAVTAGITVVFAAGNNHGDVLCKHPPAADGPNTIWGVNSVDEVITVGAVNQRNSNQENDVHSNSSRGPGQWSTRCKPDLAAPTYGEVAWGDGYRVMDWWGTSGACPQVAGAAALVLSVNPSLAPAEVGQVLRDTAVALPGPATCVGAGLLDCEAAVRAATAVRS